MKMHAIATAALAGLSAGAMGQSLSVNLSWSANTVNIGETSTATVTATLEGFADGSYLSSINIDLIASGPLGDASNVSAVSWNNAGLGFDGQGTASGADVLGVEASQFSLIPPFTTDNPIAILTFDFTMSAEGSLSYRAEVADGAPFAFSVIGPNFSDQPVAFGVEVLSSGSLNVVPAPGAMGCLGVAGLMAARGRRVES